MWGATYLGKGQPRTFIQAIGNQMAIRLLSKKSERRKELRRIIGILSKPHPSAREMATIPILPRDGLSGIPVRPMRPEEEDWLDRFDKKHGTIGGVGRNGHRGE
jgi:hypothetical protein